MDFCDSRSRELDHEIRAFRAVQDGIRLNCYRVWFHANWGANRDKVEELQKQMSYLSSEVINGELADLSRWVD
jgi:capsule polysaccharide export protein KpsC/LpsZ